MFSEQPTQSRNMARADQGRGEFQDFKRTMFPDLCWPLPFFQGMIGTVAQWQDRYNKGRMRDGWRTAHQGQRRVLGPWKRRGGVEKSPGPSSCSREAKLVQWRRGKYLVQGVEAGVSTFTKCYLAWFLGPGGFERVEEWSSPCAHSYLHFSPAAVLHKYQCSTCASTLVLHPWRDNEHLALPAAHYICAPPRSGAIQPLRSREAHNKTHLPTLSSTS